MNQAHITMISGELALAPARIEATARLLDEGATIPFISRYRKEATGSLDEVAVTAIRDRLVQLRALDERKEAVLRSMEKHGHLNEELEAHVLAAGSLSEVEDIYLPYKPRRRTRGAIAREKGLAPLAEALLAQTGIDPEKAAAEYVDPEAGVETVDDALAGARDIIAETVNEDAAARAEIRELFRKEAVFRTTLIPGMEESGAKFRDYFEYEEPVATAPSHRVLAMRRAENEGVVDLGVATDPERAVGILEQRFVTGDGQDSGQVRIAVADAYRRLLSRSMETEMRVHAKDRADEEAVRVFAENIRNLLLAPPLGQKRILAIDPGLRTGCKVVCLDAQGNLLHHTAIFPHTFGAKRDQAARELLRLAWEYKVEAIAIGNGTASRETEAFAREAGLPPEVPVVMMDEAGASVYSASDVARKEFPDHDVTVRGSVSIGRRLMDPLAELVKIDPKSVGVGQYQHDVDQGMLRQALDDVVESCVNAVGVDVNTASARLLQYVSGLGPTLAENVVAHREQNGPFRSRRELTDVPRLGPKAFEQSAGFLRIREGENPLDASAVHPESYHVVEAMAKDLGCEVADMMGDEDLRKRIDLNRYVTDALGLPTLTDILTELAKPGRDPREQLDPFAFARDVHSLEDLESGMVLPGIVTNVTNFGAFVDIGVHQDGLVHVSEMADRFVKNPADVARVQQKVEVRVLSVDLDRKRIALSMRKDPAGRGVEDRGGSQGRTSGGGRGKGRGGGPGGGKGGGGGPTAPGKKPFNNPFAELAGKGRPK
ncbi:MAG: Tex family protein [Desulfatibacillaceae bacterium]